MLEGEWRESLAEVAAIGGLRGERMSSQSQLT